MQLTPRNVPGPVIAIHVMAMIGVLFWVSQVVAAFSAGTDPWPVVLTAVVLGGAHVAISVFTARRSRAAVAAMLVVLVGDTLLAAFVDWRAVLLVIFTIVLLLLTRTSSARSWFAPPSR